MDKVQLKQGLIELDNEIKRLEYLVLGIKNGSDKTKKNTIFFFFRCYY